MKAATLMNVQVAWPQSTHQKDLIDLIKKCLKSNNKKLIIHKFFPQGFLVVNSVQ